MKRALLLLSLAATVLAPAASAVRTPVRLSEAQGPRFPDRIYVVSLGKKLQLDASRIHVTENGRPVTDVQLVPAGAQRGDFGVVLAIDASNSMKGPAISRAMEAARAFLVARGTNEAVGVIAFNRTAGVSLPFTTDATKLARSMTRTPRLGEGTHIYDAVQASLDLLAHAKISAGSIVVLSDGADTGSRATQDDVAAAARRAHVRIFTVGLRSSAFAPRPLETLASATGGSYSEAGSASRLKSIYQTLGASLSAEYLLHYRSLAGPGARQRVVVKIDGLAGGAAASYRTPELALAPPPTYHRSAIDSVLQSSASAIAVSVGAAILIAFGLLALLQTPGRGLRVRIGEFVSIAANTRDRTGGLPDRVFVGAERSLDQTRWWGRFKELVELSEIRMAPVQIALWAIVGTFAVGWVLAALVGTPIAGVGGLFVPLAIYELIAARVARKRRLFADQLPDNLQVVASALRAGHSLVGALSVVVEDAAEPTRSEFRRVVADERLGVPLEDALEVVVRRMESKELAQVALVAALQRRTGGNSAEVLDRVTELIRERAELRRLVRTLTAQGRMSRWVLTALPVALIAIISVVNPSYIDPLLHHGGGRIALAVAALMAIVGSLVIRKIVDIKI